VAHKGDVLAVECAIRPNRWTDKEGQVRYDVSLIVERILWVQSKRSAETSRPMEEQLVSNVEASSEIPF
jgi:single-stranded DNA-binding protein